MRKILLIALGLIFCAYVLFTILNKETRPDAELILQASDSVRADVAKFLNLAMDSLKKDGLKKFRDLWVNVDDMQFSANMKTLENLHASSPRILSVVNPKVSPDRVYVYARFPEQSNYDVQFVLVKTGPTYRIGGIYENRELK